MGQQQSGQAQGISGPSLQQLYEAAANPWLSPEQKAVVGQLLEQKRQEQQNAHQEQQWLGRQDYEQQLRQRDPASQLELETKRKLLENGKRQSLVNAGDGRIYDPNTGEWITAPGGNTAGGAFRFGGNSVEAQSLNGLMDSGQLTPDQAQQLGAGKTIKGPNGEIIFITPQGVFGSTADGQTQKLTGGMPTDDTGSAERGPRQSGGIIDQNERAGLNVKDQFIRGNDWIPDFAENWLVSNDFQKFDQARRDFINAQLRRESGAVISPEEFDNARQQYFPQPGDGEDVLKQKTANRTTVIKSMARDAGPTYGGGSSAALDEARRAIASGADRDAVIRRLSENGISSEGL